MRTPNRSRTALLALSGAIAGGVLAFGLAGCYERVVRADGPTADRVSVHEPNLRRGEEPVIDALDDAAWGRRP
ncbi:MAG: hypothetical protein ACYTGC_00915 [Planctomycetota bacterium]|jgi:hypothetical protein